MSPLWMGPSHRKTTKNKLSLVSVMAAMLRDSVVVVVVVRTRPRAIPLAMITTKKSLHGFPLISHDAYGASRSSAKNTSPQDIDLKVSHNSLNDGTKTPINSA